MTAMRAATLLLLLFAIAGGGGGGNDGGEDPPPGGGPTVSFQTDVLPTLQTDCNLCHGGAGGLFLQDYAGVIAGGDSGAVVVAGDPDGSLLIQRLEGTITPQMPEDLPPLSQPEIDVIRLWIAEGALDN